MFKLQHDYASGKLMLGSFTAWALLALTKQASLPEVGGMSSHNHHPSQLPTLGIFCFVLLEFQYKSQPAVAQENGNMLPGLSASERYTLDHSLPLNKAQSQFQYCNSQKILSCLQIYWRVMILSIAFTLHREKAEPSISILRFNNSKICYAT